MNRFSALIVGCVAAAALSGCGELPRPFAHQGPATQNQLVELASGEGVRVVVIDGLDPAIADPLRKAAVRALTDAGIPATSEPTLARGYVLTGAVLIDESDDSAPAAARFVFQLTGRDGLAIGAFDKEMSGTRSGWLARDPGIFDAVARDVTGQVVALLHDRTAPAPGTVDGRTEAAIPAPAQELKLYIEGVIGAPGDGNESLTRAITSALKRAGVPLAAKREEALYVLAGTVKAESRDVGVSAVSIDWHLGGRDGSDLGTVSQRNPVKTALIESRWGELAHIVAGAASDGILEALEGASAPPETGKKLAAPK